MTTAANPSIVDIVTPDASSLRAVIGSVRQSEDNHRLRWAQGTVRASRESLSVLAKQASLGGVAILVARGASPSTVFAAVADEMARCVNAKNASVNRFERDELVVLALARLNSAMKNKPVVGERCPLEGDCIATRVLHTGCPARLDDSELQNASGSIAARLREMGLHCAVAVPIVVDGRVWGMAAVGSSGSDPLPTDTAACLCDFADLAGTALINAAARAELIASRARIAAAADEARRRVERDLHDGAQQRLIAVSLMVRLAEASLPPELANHKQQLSRIASELAGVTRDLQQISRGIHPAILSDGGLRPALKSLTRRSAVPVTLDLDIKHRLRDSVEVAAYYVVAEALTNAAKHAQASEVNVVARADDEELNLWIRDDGVGGAEARKGSGLIGLQDRVAVLGGRIELVSPAATGTSLHITIPLASAVGASTEQRTRPGYAVERGVDRQRERPERGAR